MVTAKLRPSMACWAKRLAVILAAMTVFPLLGIASAEPIVGLPPKTEVSEATKAAVMAAIDKAATTNNAKKYRGGVGVYIGDAVVAERGFGPRRLTGESPEINNATTFELASVSKPLTALGIMKLVEQGRVKLTDEVGPILSTALSTTDRAQRQQVTAALKGITIEHLLAHTSGLDNDSGMSPYSEPSRDKAILKFSRSKALSIPGEKWAYNNVAYAMLAAIIEEVSGERFEQYMMGQVFVPAGMLATAFGPGTELDKEQRMDRMVSGRGAMSMSAHPWGWGYRGMGGVLTNLGEMHTLAKALQNSSLVNQATWKDIVTPRLPRVANADESKSQEVYGLGWFVEELPEGETIISHSGGSRGASAYLAMGLRDRWCVVAFGDANSSAVTMGRKLQRTIRDELTKAQRKK